jgi:hypothetical protein
MSGNVIDEECTKGASVKGGCDGSITFLAGGVPNLSFYVNVVELKFFVIK